MNPESVIVRALLTTPGRHELRLSTISAEWFNDHAHKSWFRVLTKRPLSLASASDFLLREMKDSALRTRMLAALAEIEANPATVPDADVDYAARTIVLRAKKEHILDRTRWLLDCVQEERLSKAAEVVRRLNDELIAYELGHHAPDDIGTLASAVLDHYDRAISDAIPTGYKHIDDVLGGGNHGELWLWGGYSSEGKTFSVLNLAYNVWLQGKTVMWVPREMNKRMMTELLLARHSGTLRPADPLDTRAIRRRTLDDDGRAFLSEVADSYHEGSERFHIWQAPRDTSIKDIARYLEGQRHSLNVDLLVVDYLEQLAPVRDRRSAREELNDTLGEAKDFAENYAEGRGLWLCSPHQIKRAGREECEKRKPTPHYLLGDLAESARAERDSDVVAWTLRTARLKRFRQLLVGVAKARSEETIPLGRRVYERFRSAYIGNLSDDNDPAVAAMEELDSD